MKTNCEDSTIKKKKELPFSSADFVVSIIIQYDEVKMKYIYVIVIFY